MTNSSLLGGERAPAQANGRDAGSLGPSDSSDSGSDVQGERINATTPDDESTWGAVPVDLTSDSDSAGTGERASAVPGTTASDADILPDRIDRLEADALDMDSVSLDDPQAVDVDELAADEDDLEDKDEDVE